MHASASLRLGARWRSIRSPFGQWRSVFSGTVCTAALYHADVKDSGSEQSTHSLNARLLRFRSQPESEDAYALAEDLIAAKRYGDARGVAVTAQAPDREDGQLLVLEARAWLSERDLVRAQAALLRAVRAAPDYGEAYRWLGHVLLKRGDPQRAAKTLRRAIELDPHDEESRKLVARAEHLTEALEDSADLVPASPPPSVASRAAQPSGRAVPKAAAPPGTLASRLSANQQADARPLHGPLEEEPTSRFRKLAAAAATRSTSGLIPSVKPAIPGPPDDPELGRYSAHNITAEQMALPRGPSSRAQTPPQPSGRAPQSQKPLPAAPKTFAKPDSGRARPQRQSEPKSAVSSEPPRARKTSAPPTAGRQAPTARRLVDPPTRTMPPSAPATRTSPMPPAAAAPALETWDERQGVALLDAPSVPLPAAAFEHGSTHDPLRPVDADQALQLVARYGLFEQPRGAQGPDWAAPHEVEARGTRVRNALIGLWVFTLLACVGGYFGWQAFVEQRHARAAAWVQDARSLMQRGDHAGLVDAERLLRLAREQHPASTDIPLEALLLQVERVLEDGERDLAALKSALGRAPVSTEGKAAQDVASAVIAAFSGDRALRDKLLDQALAGAPGDARRLHLLGRLEERLGRPQAREHIEAALSADANLIPARLALAQLALDAGERSDALARVDSALAVHKEHLRARLLRMFISADDQDPAQLRAAIAGLGDAMKLAGPIDELLAALIDARLSRREGQTDAAIKAIERASALAVDEPRLLAWVAREALAVGKPALAQTAAGRALSVAPDVAPYRRLMARVLIERADGARARELLDKLPAEDAEAQIMKAQAALLEDDENALRAALTALTQLPAGKAESMVLVGALKVRLESKLTPSKAVVDRAKALVRSAPGDPDALLALAEAGLAAHDPATASGALKQRFAVAPDDPSAHYLLGRARRMAADAEGAEASFRKALTLSPGQNDALLALGGLLLDEGKFEEADAVFQELASRGGSALSGRLGRVEALIGLGRSADAQVQLDGLPDAQRQHAAYRTAAARVALARGKPGEALAQLRPLLETQTDKPALFALYGDALLAAEQLEGAAGAYDKALDLDPGLPEALLGAAQVKLRANKPNDALPLLERAKSALADRIRPPALRAQRFMLVGQAYLARNKRGDADNAKQVLHEATKIDGAPAEAHYWLAEALGGKTNPEARAAYQRYLELAPSGKYAERARRAAGQ
jgi:tetratricopeptide (TPR) repeat protein